MLLTPAIAPYHGRHEFGLRLCLFGRGDGTKEWTMQSHSRET